jgi:hypothetical protein
VILTDANRRDVTRLPCTGRGHPAHQRQAGQTTIEASGRSGRQRLRPRQLSASPTCRRHCDRNRPTWDKGETSSVDES